MNGAQWTYKHKYTLKLLGGYILKSVWYELQQITKSGNSITDTFVFDTKEEAQAEMEFYKEFMPEYNYKIIKCSGNTL